MARVQFKVKLGGMNRLSGKIVRLQNMMFQEIPAALSFQTAKAGEKALETWFLEHHQFRGNRLKQLIFVKRLSTKRAQLNITGEAALFQSPGTRQHWIHKSMVPIKQWLTAKGKPVRNFVNYPVPWSDMGRGIDLEQIAIQGILEQYPKTARTVQTQIIKTLGG
jgi:hypothetical protein